MDADMEVFRMKTQLQTLHIDEMLNRYPALAVNAEEIKNALTLLYETVTAGGRVYVCGNGGSAADAQHIVGELMKGFLSKRPVTLPADIARKLSPASRTFLEESLQGAIPAHSLTGEAALVSALINDVSADMIFAQQVYGYGRAGDVLICISTSGNARNVCLAAELAAAMGMRTLALTGKSGGSLAPLCELSIRVPSQATYEIQEYHLPVYHALCADLEANLF
jgi:D-sedoheptulose 7-phosphate isomerase